MTASIMRFQLPYILHKTALQQIALAGNRLAILATNGTLYVVQVAPSGATELFYTRSFDWPPAPLALAPSGRYVLLRDAARTRQIRVWDIHRDTAAITSISCHGLSKKGISQHWRSNRLVLIPITGGWHA